MKVMHVIYGLQMGGAEALVKDYALHMHKKGQDVTVLCLHKHGSKFEQILEDEGVNIKYVADVQNVGNEKLPIKKIVRRLKFYFYMNYLINTEKYDAIHMHLGLTTYMFFSFIPKKTKLFYTVHSEPQVMWNLSNKAKIEKKVIYRLIRRKNLRLITINERMRLECNEMFGINNSITLNNGIDFNRFDIFGCKDKYREMIDVPMDAYLVGHVGRFTESKNHKFLVEVFEQILKQKDNAYLLMIGNGETKSSIEKLCEIKGIRDRVRILSNRTDVSELMETMDVLVFPSKFEGLPVTLVEAQKKQLKCVISDTIVKDVQISNLIKTLSLDLDSGKWAAEVVNFDVSVVEYTDLDTWNMDVVVDRLCDIYKEDV